LAERSSVELCQNSRELLSNDPKPQLNAGRRRAVRLAMTLGGRAMPLGNALMMSGGFGHVHIKTLFFRLAAGCAALARHSKKKAFGTKR
jgi:hypothetical protein